MHVINYYSNYYLCPLGSSSHARAELVVVGSLLKFAHARLLVYDWKPTQHHKQSQQRAEAQVLVFPTRYVGND